MTWKYIERVEVKNQSSFQNVRSIPQYNHSGYSLWSAFVNPSRICYVFKQGPWDWVCGLYVGHTTDELPGAFSGVDT